MNKEVKGLR